MGAWIWRPVCMALLCVCMAATPLSWADSAPALPASAFTLSIDAPQGIAEGLMRHLELQRYKDVQDLDDTELKRLIDAGELVQFSPEMVEIDHTFHIAHTVASARRPFVQTVIDWLEARP